MILFDSGTTSQASVREVFTGKSSISISGIQVDLKLINNISIWKETVLKAKKGRFLFSKTQLEKWNLTLPQDVEKEAEFTQ